MIIGQIIDWANEELDAWKREAIKLFLTKDSLDDEDKDRLFEMLKKHHKLPFDNTLSIYSEYLLKKEGIVVTEEQSMEIVLREIKGIRNVNALPDDSILSFANTGMTVIYGENGTGKSGYTRIFKKACFARDQKEKIHGNIFSTSPITKPEAVFKLDVDGNEMSYNWVDGNSKPEILGNICVFDNLSARVIVDDKNSISYLPYGADVFQKLVILIKELKIKLTQEKPTLSKPNISDMPETTKAGAFFASLNSQTTIEDLELLCHWNGSEDDNSDERKLADLNAKYITAKNGDTTKQVLSLENLKSRIRSFQEQMSQAACLFSLESVKHFNQLIESRTTLQKAYEIASQEPEGPLPGIATTEWEALYWAAKEYSIKQAYPGEAFPATDGHRKCVLCMQGLSQKAGQRLSNFHQYMESSIKQNFDGTNNEIANFIDSLKIIDCVKINTNYKDVIDEISNRNKNISREITDCLDNSLELQKTYLRAEKGNEKCVAEVIELNFKQFEIIEKLIDSEIEEYKKNSNPEELKKLETELAGLKARKQFAFNSGIITSYLYDLKKVALYDIVINSLETRSITQKGKKLIGQALTPQIKKALSDELKSLGLLHIPLDLKHSGSDGENTHQMKIQTQKGISVVKLTEVLSEGEQRVIAIAAFLAELNLQEKPMPIVFDDPVSSLDHKYSEKIATRLVEESKNRQIIIFTHDISFMLDLQRKSEENRLYCHCVSVHREGNIVGKIRGETAWHIMKVRQRLHFIDEELIQITPLFPDDRQEYNSKVAVLYGYLRETWEATIEEILFNNTITRFSANVKTQSLKNVVIESEDYDIICKGMTQCSKWMIGHDLSKVISENRPCPADFQQDIKELRDFTDRIKARIKVTKNSNEIEMPQIG